MAAYNTAKWSSSAGDLDTVLTALNTKLETLDDTTGTALAMGVAEMPNSQFRTWLIHKG